MTALGAVFLPQLSPERLRDVARAADDAGLQELWLWEDCFWESGIASAAAALAWTERLHIGVGLLPVPLRNVALTAMEVATLHRLFLTGWTSASAMASRNGWRRSGCGSNRP
jgi:alkanesulfonate monooxygenase SsuD/methylene tetrahydromethanopterin reductase-like flavin-dependent oxidoreductase (luciferase family)